MRQRRHQDAAPVPALLPRAADGLAVDRDHAAARKAVQTWPSGSEQPGTTEGGCRGRATHSRADERANARRKRGLLREPGRVAAGPAWASTSGPGIGGPCPIAAKIIDRDHRRDPDGQQPQLSACQQPRLSAGPVTWVKQIEQVLAAGSRDRRRCSSAGGDPAAGD